MDLGFVALSTMLGVPSLRPGESRSLTGLLLPPSRRSMSPRPTAPAIPEPPVNLDKYPEQPQKMLSLAVDTASFEDLLSKSSGRNYQRFLRVAARYASGWVTAVPSSADNNECIMSPQDFRLSVSNRLGLPIFPPGSICPLCKQPLDSVGDHVNSCTCSGDAWTRHNKMRGGVGVFGNEAQLSPKIEGNDICKNDPLLRPGDVRFPIWSSDKGLAVDCAVISPFAHLDWEFPCENYAAQKHQMYDAKLEGSKYALAALVWETTGGICEEGAHVLNQIFSFAAKRSGVAFSTYAGRAWCRISCTLQKAVNARIMNRRPTPL